MIAGHITLTYALHQGLEDKIPAVKKLGLPALLTGALLPDILDKPFSYAFDIPGRGVAHSIFVLAVLFYVLFRVLPRHRHIVTALLAGTALHLAEDAPFLQILFWPMLGEWKFLNHFGFVESLRIYYLEFHNPVMLLMEALSYPFFLYYLFRPKENLEPALADEAPAA